MIREKVKPFEVERMKRAAKKERKDNGVAHVLTLNRLAKERGYNNWQHLMQNVAETN